MLKQQTDRKAENGEAPVSRVRESKKADKRRRIATAAYELFSEHGYEGTTLRQIAHYAGVALGTLSLYASDKRDLVLLLFNERIPHVSEAAERAAAKESEFIDKLIAYFRVLNQHFLNNIKLSRIHLQLNYYSGGMHSAEYYANRQRLFDFIQNCVREAQDAGTMAKSEDPTLIARHFFFVYSAALRWWLAAEKPDLQTGLDQLRPHFELLMRGLAAGGRRAADARPKTSPKTDPKTDPKTGGPAKRKRLRRPGA